MEDKKQYYKYMDVARGAALLVIIVSHANGINFFLIASAVPAFFVFSGYFFRAGRSYGENVKKKAKRLLLPYFGYSALLWLFYAAIRRDVSEMLFSLFGVVYSRYSVYDPVTHEDAVGIMNIANGAMWYLTAAFVVALLFYLIADKCMASWKITVAWSVLLLLCSMAIDQLPVLLPWSVDMAGMFTIFMLAGAWLRKTEFYEKKAKWWMMPIVLLVYLAIGTVGGYLNSSIRQYGSFGSLSAPVYMVFSILGGVLYIWVAKWIQNTVIGDFFACLGVHSMELLCVHMVVLEVFEVAAGRFFELITLSGMTKIIYEILRIATAIIVSLAVGRVVSGAKKKCSKKEIERNW